MFRRIRSWYCARFHGEPMLPVRSVYRCRKCGTYFEGVKY